MKTECRSRVYYATLLSVALVAVFAISGCTNPEKAKIAHVEKGEAYLKDEKFQEASLEFRNAIQIDEKLASAHWGLARAYEGLQRFQEAFEELRKTTELDKDNLDARVNDVKLRQGSLREKARASQRGGSAVSTRTSAFDDFDRFHDGDFVEVAVEPGALGIPWYYGVYRR